MQLITSKENSTIKEIKKLKDKKYRFEMSKFIIEGFRFVEEGLKSDFLVDKILVKESIIDKFKDKFINYIEQYEDKIFVVGDSIFKSISSTDNSQGVLAVIKMDSKNVIPKDGIYILVDRVQDPGNLGTIIRTADSAGCAGVIIIKGTVDLYNEKTLRSTMGSIFNIDIIQEDESLEFTKNLIENNYNLICSSLKTDKNFYDVDLDKNSIIAVGNEGNGVSDEVMKLATTMVKIPMLGSAESLNVAIATSIMIYEGVRQRILSGKY